MFGHTALALTLASCTFCTMFSLIYIVPYNVVALTLAPCVTRSTLLALHCTAVLRHDETGQEVLLNLLLRNYLHYNLYDQVISAP